MAKQNTVQARVPNERLQRAVLNVLQERPEWQQYLDEMIEWEEQNPPKDRWDGWTWKQVHTAPSIINQLIGQGIVSEAYSSRSQAVYRLAGREDTKDAIGLLAMRPKEEKTSVTPEDLFALVVGHDNVKWVLRRALTATNPVHALLVGPPGTAKTLMLMDIKRLSGAEFYVGSTTTKSGLVGMLLERQPTILVIDEIDKMAYQDMYPLLNLMEGGMVTRLMHGHQERVQLRTRVFAGANNIKNIEEKLPALYSRFHKLEVPAYSPSQFVSVMKEVYVRNEGLGPEMALLIANEVSKYTMDIREAIFTARMIIGDDPKRINPREVPTMVARLCQPKVNPLKRA